MNLYSSSVGIAPEPRNGGWISAPLPLRSDTSSAPAAVGSELRPRVIGRAVRALPPPVVPRAFTCRCGRPVFFRNSECLACHTPLGYDARQHVLLPLELAGASFPLGSAPPVATSEGRFWQACSAATGAAPYLRCSNLNSAAACNWLIDADDAFAGVPALCRCCRLTRTLPDLTRDRAAAWWALIELAKRRLVSALVALNLPVASKTREDPQRGLVFDLLRAQPGGPPVVTGHEDGVITLDVEEADDAWREQRRHALGEPYRTLLGHLRHESGHYYWQRLVENGPLMAEWRELFGDERQDYAAALIRHYAEGPPADWGQRFVSAYASSHPWEDWAETWAHYLHLRDTLDTASSFGLDGERVELHYDRYGVEALSVAGGEEFVQLVNSWMELTGVLNELSRSMGLGDFYPFVLSKQALRKLHLVHRVISSCRTTCS